MGPQRGGRRDARLNPPGGPRDSKRNVEVRTNELPPPARDEGAPRIAIRNGVTVPRSRRPPPCCRVVVGPISQDRLLVGVCSAVRRPRPCRPAHPAPLVLQGFAMSRCRTSAGCGTGRRPVVGPSRSAAATGKASKSEAVGRPAACERRRVRRSRALPPQAAAGAPPRTTLLQPLYQR